MALKSGMSPSAPSLELLLPYAIYRGQPALEEYLKPFEALGDKGRVE